MTVIELDTKKVWEAVLKEHKWVPNSRDALHVSTVWGCEASAAAAVLDPERFGTVPNVKMELGTALHVLSPLVVPEIAAELGLPSDGWLFEEEAKPEDATDGIYDSDSGMTLLFRPDVVHPVERVLLDMKYHFGARGYGSAEMEDAIHQKNTKQCQTYMAIHGFDRGYLIHHWFPVGSTVQSKSTVVVPVAPNHDILTEAFHGMVRVRKLVDSGDPLNVGVPFECSPTPGAALLDCKFCRALLLCNKTPFSSEERDKLRKKR